MEDKKAFAINGYLGLIITIVLVGLSAYLIYGNHIIIGPIIFVLTVLFASSLTVVRPNEAKIVLFFGNYLGTIRRNGLFMTIPLAVKTSISLKVRNFNSARLKVNDIDGNPIEIAAVVVFKVVAPAKAYFDVDHYEEFIEIQSETALRHVATKYPYDTFSDDDITLRGNADEVSLELQKELQNRLTIAGVEIVEARLTHLAYSTEIASAMLQRQQAKAILAARETIVEGAVGMAQSAVKSLEKDATLKLSDQARVQLVNNLLVSIVAEKGSQPVVSIGDVNE